MKLILKEAIIMKKSLLSICFLSVLISSHAQNGLEGIIVEKYYVTNANDTTVNADGGVLPVGSTTYRIFADMLPGYKFQAAYGVPGHELRLQTTTLFFNNEDRGATSPTYSKTQAQNNTVMLDSWLSVGGACNGNVGLLKADDDGVNTVSNADGVLQNNDTAAGLPLSVQDGMIAGSPEAVTFVGISTEIAMFDNLNDGSNGPLFSTSNGSWASLNGSYGPDSSTNRVLIAQITTDGMFTFELNIQIKSSNGVVEQYVARDPAGNEILEPTLIYTSLIDKVNELTSYSNPLFVVYPNPVKDKISLELQTEKQRSRNSYTLYDTEGRILLHKVIGPISEYYFENIDLSSFSKGQYIIEFTSDSKSSSRQVIVE